MPAVGAVVAHCARLRPPCCVLLPASTLPVAPPRLLARLRAALCNTQHITAFTAAHLAPAAGVTLPLLLIFLLLLPTAVLHPPSPAAAPAPLPAAVSFVPCLLSPLSHALASSTAPVALARAALACRTASPRSGRPG